jgi:hypothetical protein
MGELVPGPSGMYGIVRWNWTQRRFQLNALGNTMSCSQCDQLLCSGSFQSQ